MKALLESVGLFLLEVCLSKQLSVRVIPIFSESYRERLVKHSHSNYFSILFGPIGLKSLEVTFHQDDKSTKCRRQLNQLKSKIRFYLDNQSNLQSVPRYSGFY